MADQQARPPIVTAIRNDASLPFIPTKESLNPKSLHDASESAKQVDLPRVLNPTPSDYYTKVADRFLDTADFRQLDGFDLGHTDPTIMFHRNESDVARSIEESINREVGLILIGGHTPGTLEIDSTTQAWKQINNRDSLPFEPKKIILIPDWTAKCTLTAPGKKPVESMLVSEYKDRGLIVVDELETEINMTGARRMQLWAEVQNRLTELTDRLETANPEVIAPDLIGLTSGLRSYMSPHQREDMSTFGVQNHPKSSFEADVTTTLQQLTTYAVGEDTPYAILGDYQSLAIFEFPDMLNFPKVNDIDRFRRGPGNEVRVLVLKNESRKIRRNMIGAWLKNIGSETGEAWMKSTGSGQDNDMT
ncbi:hypothetical protein CCUS01_05065 [Colletotrichum cuscutae]|uniref:Uncharacterized protein n=1 Tax=Colletotrichum cuscutae TaxID=1209917 RepID=A0AAI9Y6K1_9PEZI|nr:hypothetical protein CCUS01_05065 [Colletotrichum cuscutae]